MRTSLSIAVADDERDTREFLAEALERAGHKIVGCFATGDELVKAIHDKKPDLVVADIRMPEIDGIEAATIANHERPIPFILVSAFHDQETLDRASAGQVFGYLIKPISEADLKTAISLAIVRFEQFQALLKDTHDLRQALDDRKIIEKAKGILMKRNQVDEEEAYRRLRKAASQQNVKLNEVCRKVISAEQVFRNLAEQ